MRYNNFRSGCFLCKCFLDVDLPDGDCCRAPGIVNWTWFALAVPCCVVDGVIAPELTGVLLEGEPSLGMGCRTSDMDEVYNGAACSFKLGLEL